MKLLLAQLNTTVAALGENVKSVRAALDRGRREGADLVVFPELTTVGYPPRDLLERAYFIDQNRKALDDIVAATAPADGKPGIGAVVGFVDRNDERPGQGLYNSAALIDSGHVVGIYRKCLLPTYDVFDEARYFDPGGAVHPFEFRGRRIGISICEDIWNDELYWSHRRYTRDPVAELVSQNVDFLINISASPYTLGKRETKRTMLAHAARRYGLNLVHVNLVGGNDDLIFDGWSNAFNGHGEIIAQCRDFEEDFAVVDLDSGKGERRPESEGHMERLRLTLELGIRDYVRKCGFQNVLLGLSGGIDSALVAALAAEALGPDHVLGVSMPSRYSSEGSKSDAEVLARNLKIEFQTIPIEDMFGSALASLAPHFQGRPPDTAEENIQSRLRGLTLMALSNKFGKIVLATGNKSELSVGYATLYGDMCGGLAPIADVPKVMVYELARYLNQRAAPRPLIPEETLTKPPSAELRDEQKDTDSLPEYVILDPILHAYVEEHRSADDIIAEGFDRATVERVIGMFDRAEYKRRQAPPTLKVTSRAFGHGWRMPLARGKF